MFEERLMINEPYRLGDLTLTKQIPTLEILTTNLKFSKMILVVNKDISQVRKTFEGSKDSPNEYSSKDKKLIDTIKKLDVAITKDLLDTKDT